MTLMAQVEQARNRHQESNQQLSAASGVAKSIAVATEIERFRLSRSATDIADRVGAAQSRLGILKEVMGENPRTRRTFAIAEGATRAHVNGFTVDPKDGKLLDEIEARNQRVGFTPRGHVSDSSRYHGKRPGRAQNTHAEQKALADTPGSRAVAASRPMCGFDKQCGGRLGSLAMADRKPYVAANAEGNVRGRIHPEATRVFFRDGHVDDRLPSNMSAEERSRYGREAVLDQVGRETSSKIGNRMGSSFGNRMGSLSQTVTEGLGSGAGRFASRALGPVGVALDAYSLKEAWDEDGGKVGENFKETAGGVVGGVVGGVAIGAALGSVVPGVGTVIGGVIGGIAGSIGGEWIGGLL
jgi:hypothetical protein